MQKRYLAAIPALILCLAMQLPAVSAAEQYGLGDLNNDQAVNASDAAMILMASAAEGAGSGSGLSDAQAAAADVNYDKTVNASDAALVLDYAAFVGAGGVLDIESYLYPLPEGTYRTEAVYLGVVNYGDLNKTVLAKAESFTYRFSVDGAEKIYKLDNSEKEEDGSNAFPLQNLLKENYHFVITVQGDTIIDVRETETGLPTYDPPISGTPGELTLRNFLTLAMEPVGTTLYMYGGGWNWQDEGSVAHTRSIGVSPDWVRFYNEHDASYTYRDKNGSSAYKNPKTSYYPYGGFNEYYYAGLDCSGYVSWALYNVLNTKDGEQGYVGKSTAMAKRLAGYGWGTWQHSFPTPTGTPETAMKPGDIMSMSGHVWISLGTCSDGSVVIAHSTPSNSVTGQPGGGVQIGAAGNSTSCQAYKLAQRYMSTYYPEWCKRYTVTLKSKSSYLAASAADAGRFRWNAEWPLTDPDGIQNMSAEEALALIFSETD